MPKGIFITWHCINIDKGGKHAQKPPQHWSNGAQLWMQSEAAANGCPRHLLPGVHCYAETLVKDNGNVNQAEWTGPIC